MNNNDLLNVIRSLLATYRLRESHGEDTIGVLMKAGCFKYVQVAQLATKLDELDSLAPEVPADQNCWTKTDWRAL
jgi:hypothetical protein